MGMKGISMAKQPVRSDRQRAKTGKKKSFPWPLVLIVAAAAILFPVSGFAFAATRESHDSFCGSCHTQPESTYLDRSTTAPPVDMASFHTGHQTRCIDCHSGVGISGRISAEMMGASNAVKWLTKTAAQPAPLHYPINDTNCLKCHQQVTDQNYVPKNQALVEMGDAQNGHWHLFLRRWQSSNAKAATCVTCHSGHSTDVEAGLLFLNRQQVQNVCQDCHNSMQE